MLPTTIVDLQAEPLGMPLREPFAIATGAQAAADNVLCRVHLHDGTEGLGEAAPFPAVSGETQAGALAAVRAAAELLRGRDARGGRALADLLREALPDQPAARAGVEMALLDALSRHYRQPLWIRFGGAGQPVRTDMTVTAGDAGHAGAAARAITARGITTIKVKVGALSPDEDAARLLAVHRAAPDARLYVDANGGYDPRGALRLLALARDAGVPLALFEQPVPREDWHGLNAVAAASAVPVCADESARSTADVLRLCRDGAVRAVNLKVMKAGVFELLAMWSAARGAGLGLMIGAMVEGPLAISFAAHLAAGLGGFDFVDLDTHLFLESHPFQGGFTQHGEELRLDTDAPGHGVTLRPG